jgi:hypothetical protein
LETGEVGMAKLVTMEGLGRAAFLLLGILVVFVTVRRMLHGVFTFYSSWDQGFLFSPPFIFIGAWFIWMGLRKKSLKESFETKQEDDKKPPMSM